MLLSLHSESKSGHATRLKAGDGKSVIVPYPSLTLFATGIGKFVYQAITPEATMKIKELRYNADEISKRLYESGLETGAAIYCRLYEKTLKLAAHHAISANWEKPVMTLEGVVWANRLATHLTKSMLYQSQFYVAEGSFDKLKKRILAMLDKNGGQMDRSQMLRNLPVDAATLRKILTTLKVCDLIEDEVVPSGKVVILMKKAA